jgi:hypothetical protein
LPLPKPKTHFDLAGALAEGFLGGAFAGVSFMVVLLLPQASPRRVSFPLR